MIYKDTVTMKKDSFISASALLSCGVALFTIGVGTSAEFQEKALHGVDTLQVADHTQEVVGYNVLNSTTVEVLLRDGKRMTLDFYGENVFRLFRDDKGGIIRDPQAKPDAKILAQQPRKAVEDVKVTESKGEIIISTKRIEFSINRKSGLFEVKDLKSGKTPIKQTRPIKLDGKESSFGLQKQDNEYFYGGGVQNGRFSHQGKLIAIENQNSWTDGGVASPTPFYWSTKGYGVMWHTFKKGHYDFGANKANEVQLSHQENYLDAFIMVNDGAVPLLNDFYQLTGKPVLLPKFAFYQGHLNAYNRDFWKEDENGILFEDGKRYKESQKDNGGIKETLNGENGNYQFSARAAIDRYVKHDMPLGWFLPNDGYGAGYGQTDSLEGNVENLRKFTEYARKFGVEVGLWTQSDMHPKEGVSPLLQRDLVREVRDAGVRVLKTDVAWVGAGYSFGLNGVTDVAQIMTYYGNEARPFIISLDGWAGTQRYAGIWTGDQTGGEWEYIRFHIPTYIGAGLSGQPNISSDMDGIFGGKNMAVNVRDFQWKTFTPMELNMDGWGSNPKYPHVFDEPATSINRWYLKLKSELMPYTYTIARESVDGLPMVRAMFLEYPNEYTLGKATQYQFMYGPSILVAPIYQDTAKDDAGNDVRHGIYLPEGQWIDYFSGDVYEGGKIYNSFDSPIWKLPVFVKRGAIIPMVNPNNNVYQIDKGLRIFDLYPAGNTSFTMYDDDGVSEAYRVGAYTTTLVECKEANGEVSVSIAPTKGNFKGFEKNQKTEFLVNVTQKPSSVTATVSGQTLNLKEASSLADYQKQENVFFYDAQPNINRFATPNTEFAKKVITKNPVLKVKLAAVDTTKDAVALQLKGYVFAPVNKYLSKKGALKAPLKAQVTEENTAPYSLTPTWEEVANADYYEIEFQGMLYSTIKENKFLFESLLAETPYSFKLRAVNSDGVSDWTTFSATTKSNPLEFAIPGIVATTSCENQGSSLEKLFDYQEKEVWHTKYSTKAVPFDLVLDLKSVNKLDKFQYLPRFDGSNGTIKKATISYSMDKNEWTKACDVTWEANGETKEVAFEGNPTARFIKFHVTEAVGDYGSGREIYVFKVPGSESYIPGDINNDGKVDANDLTSYMNYTGLRKGDSDFEGYISNGDINGNGLIDAYDISVVATQLDSGKQAVAPTLEGNLAGSISLSADKNTFDVGEIVQVVVKGENLRKVNALSFALPYDASVFDFVGVEQKAVNMMENLTYDRLHGNGDKVLYPTFVNVGAQPIIEGNKDLFIIKLKAKKAGSFDLKQKHTIIVDKDLMFKSL